MESHTPDSVADVLIIDDVIENLAVLTAMLNNAGYRVRPARDARSGLRAARMVPPDLILLDIRLPDMDGFEVCLQLKEDRKLRDIPVIFISALHDVASKVQGFRVGGHDYITKPFEAQEVLARINNQIEIRRLRQERQHLIRMQERQHIARELHDSVNQTLFILGSTAQALLVNDHRVPDGLKERLDMVHRLSQAALAEMRTLLFELRPDMLRQSSLKKLIEQLVESLRTRTEATLAVIIDSDEVERANELKVSLYRITQEALTNAIKHASANLIKVQIHHFAGEGRLLIADDGIGFDIKERGQIGMGLTNMHERAQEAGITLSVESEIGKGTRVMGRWEI